MAGEQICPKCKASNRAEAHYCLSCGAQLLSKSGNVKPAQPINKASREAYSDAYSAASLVNQVKQRAADLFRRLDDQLDHLLGGGKDKTVQRSDKERKNRGEKQSEKQSGKQSDLDSTQPRIKPVEAPGAGATRSLPRLPAHSPGDLIGNYLVLSAWRLARSNYYQACRSKCPNGHPVELNSADRCRICQTEMPRFLIHEVPAHPTSTEANTRQKVIASCKTAFKTGVPGALVPQEIFFIKQGGQERQYLVAVYPAESWVSLYKMKLPPPDPRQVVNWCRNLGQALTELDGLKLAPDFPSLTELLEALIVVRDQLIYADMTYFALVSENGNSDEVGAHLTQMQVLHLGQVMYSISSGKYQKISLAPLELGDVPPPFRRLLDRARRTDFNNLSEFLGLLETALDLHEPARSLRQATGYRTSSGRARSHNEDFIGKYSLGLQQAADMPEVGLYIVADGMGGHQAGELASSQVVRTVLEQVQNKLHELQSVPRVKRQTIKLDETLTPGEVLAGAIQQANEILHNARQQLGTDRGTTITAALVIGDIAVIANVGDSRTYLFHSDTLVQVTRDHSLVASLLAAKLIRPEDVRSHPHRNSILRSMGEQPKVEVDLFQRQLAVGDRLLLCSDGLWEMVLDSDIVRILRQASTPQAACDRLIEAANLAGGDDNISAIVVYIE